MLYNPNARWQGPMEREQAELIRHLAQLDRFKKKTRKERSEKPAPTQEPMAEEPMADEVKRMIRRLRGAFSQEWTWRVYVVLTIAGIAGVVVLDLSQHYWDLLWDIFDPDHWNLSSATLYRYANWLVMLLIFGPFLVAKALDYITEKGKT